MMRFRPYSLELSNFFGEHTADSSQVYDVVIDNPDYGEHQDLHYRQFNVERQQFPYPDETFDGVLFCEVLEHLTTDPMAALAEMHRVLKPNGWLLITTPNASWYQNIANLSAGRNSVTLAYSPHGPYGRHNREYTFSELQELVQAIGFDVERLDTRDLQPGRHLNWNSRIIKALHPSRYYEEGLFCVARKRHPLTLAHPAWLYALGDRMPVPSYLQKPAT
jgi:predicted SAM-dependent methyltransferase